MDILIIFVILGLAYLVGEIFNRLGLPVVLGQIFVGVILGIQFFRDLLFDPAQFPHRIEILSYFAEFGIIFIMFFIGLKIDIKEFIKSSKEAFLVALFAAVTPFLMGFFLFRYFGFGYITSLVVAISLSVTAEAVIIDILEQLKIVKSKVGEVIIEAGIIDDAIGIILVTGLVTFIKAKENSLVVGVWREVGTIAAEIVLFALIIFVARYYIFPGIWKFVEKENSEVNEFTGAVLIALLIAGIGHVLGVSSVIGAVVAGILVRQILVHEGKKGIMEEKRITKIIEVITFGLLAPFFFISIGMKVDLSILFLSPLIGIVLSLVAFAGKIIGSIIGGFLSRVSIRESWVLGWGMSTRGAVELVVLGIALEAGLISKNIFSALVFMMVVTTIISPIIFKGLLKRTPSKQLG